MRSATQEIASGAYTTERFGYQGKAVRVLIHQVVSA